MRGCAARRVVVLLLFLLLQGCMALPKRDVARAEAIAAAAQSSEHRCAALPTGCAQASPLRALAARARERTAADGQPRHEALLLEYGQDALLARISLIRSATTRIDLQTYILDEDDAGQWVIDELLAAARRGVRVRVLVDQLSALEKVQTLAALAGVHRQFELRIYNPVLERAQLDTPHYLLAAACCWRTLNRRMHTKLLLVDGAVAITGGRNYQNAYYDWDPDFNFRDRDVLVAGPVVAELDAVFVRFWNDARARRLTGLRDVGRYLLRRGVPPRPPARYTHPQRVAELSADADDPALVAQVLGDRVLSVGNVTLQADLPGRAPRDHDGGVDDSSSRGLRDLMAGARESILLQTPYLVLSEPAQALFRQLRLRDMPPTIDISTNSLAATDSFITYALAYKYKRRYLRDFGFRMYEFKPFPLDIPADIEATGALEALDRRQSRDSARALRRAPFQREHAVTRFGLPGSRNPVPLRHAGVRFGLHAKSMVIDDRIGVVGSNNFDPRGDTLNTELSVVIDDAAFARVLAASIRRDMAPENSWVIGRRHSFPILPGIEYTLAMLSARLPVFDLWPTRYATSYAFVPGPACPAPVPPDHPDFHACHRAVGDFPEVQLGPRWLLTRIFTGFGAGLAPIL